MLLPLSHWEEQNTSYAQQQCAEVSRGGSYATNHHSYCIKSIDSAGQLLASAGQPLASAGQPLASAGQQLASAGQLLASAAQLLASACSSHMLQ